jgi:integrase
VVSFDPRVRRRYRPLAYRLLWGFLVREGMREGEALALTWGDLDLERGAVRLDKNKTDDPRAWALSPGVATALSLYKARYRPRADADSLVFLDPNGRPVTKYGLADSVRTASRSIFYASGPNSSRRRPSADASACMTYAESS